MRLFALSFMIALTAAAPSAPNLGWRTYTNVKFGYATCYPSALLKELPAVPADDGRVFTARDGAEERVFGQYSDRSVSALSEELTRDLIGQAGKLTYKTIHSDWAVISGTRGNFIFWAKVMKRDDRFATVQIIHPATLMDRYKSIPGWINRCSSMGTAAF